MSNGSGMRRMSFALTSDAMLDRSKTVTRRLGWDDLRAGDELLAVRSWRAGRMAKGNVLGMIRVLSVRSERLDAVDAEDVRREGLDCTPEEFVRQFCHHMGSRPESRVTRIEFEHVGTGDRTGPP